MSVMLKIYLNIWNILILTFIEFPWISFDVLVSVGGIFSFANFIHGH